MSTLDPGWFAPPNLSGLIPVVAPPKDRPIIVRNRANRIKGGGLSTTEHLTWWDAEMGCFVRLRDDLFRDTIFTFFHQWREFGDEDPH